MLLNTTSPAGHLIVSGCLGETTADRAKAHGDLQRSRPAGRFRDTVMICLRLMRNLLTMSPWLAIVFPDPA